METGDLLTSQTKWFRCLVPKKLDSPGKKSPDLMSNYSEKDLTRGLLICAITHSDHHIFALFSNYVNFAKFNQSLPEKKRCFFEIILGDHYQKPRFDLEVEAEKLPDLSSEELASLADHLLQEFLIVLIPLFKELYNIELNLEMDLLLFTSHGPKKRSFHVVIDNYCHGNHREAKAFYEEVIKRLPEELRKFIDGSVYSKKQQFRIVGSQKRGSGRIKTLLSPWSFQDKQVEYKFREEPRNPGHRLVLLLEASLVSYTNNCRLLVNLLPEETKVKDRTWDQESDDLHPETVRVAFNLLGKKAGISVTTPGFPYEVRDVMGGLILLTRKYPSKCQICHRIHEHENPYLLVMTDENKIRRVYFDCRRAEGRKLYLGILPEEVNDRYLPDAPFLQESQDILTKLGEVAKIPMKQVRGIKNGKQ